MLANATRLADLIERGHRAGLAGANSSRTAASTGEPTWSNRPRPAVNEKFERLAVELISLSLSPTEDPRGLIREALLAIESCLESIKSHN